MLNMKRLSFILCGILFFAVHMAAQNGAQISADELTYNFGTIAEADGLASHTFVIKNTGDGPLVITRITASCGCTQPEWTKEPIAPGKTGNVKVTVTKGKGKDAKVNVGNTAVTVIGIDDEDADTTSVDTGKVSSSSRGSHGKASFTISSDDDDFPMQHIMPIDYQ